MIQDLHSHTYYSFCGKDTPEAIVEAAIAGGLDTFGITDHNYGIGYARHSVFCATANMELNNYERTLRRYYDHINLIKEKYAGQINVLRGIEICNAWFSTFLISKPYEETESAFEKHVAFLAAMGAKVVGVSEQSYSTQGIQTQPVFEGKYEMNDREWDALCQGLNRLGKLSLEKYGVSLTFHHHMGTVVQTAAETDRRMAGTDPAYVNLLFDSGHFAYCGEDPVAMVTKHAKRIRHVHLKDIRPDVVARVRSERLSFLEGVRQGAFTIPGDGCVEFDPIFRVLAESGYEGYMVVEAEQDPAKANPLEYAIRARKFIRDHSGL